jgi:hypothetical protein
MVQSEYPRRFANLKFRLDSGLERSVYWKRSRDFGLSSRQRCSANENGRMTKKLIFFAMGAAGVVALLSVLDLSLHFPFGGYSLTMDILYLVAAAIVLFMGWETYRENR